MCLEHVFARAHITGTLPGLADALAVGEHALALLDRAQQLPPQEELDQAVAAARTAVAAATVAVAEAEADVALVRAMVGGEGEGLEGELQAAKRQRI